MAFSKEIGNLNITLDLQKSLIRERIIIKSLYFCDCLSGPFIKLPLEMRCSFLVVIFVAVSTVAAVGDFFSLPL